MLVKRTAVCVLALRTWRWDMDTDAHVQTCVACVGSCRLFFLSGLCKDLAHGCVCGSLLPAVHVPGGWHCQGTPPHLLPPGSSCTLFTRPRFQPPEEMPLPSAGSVGSAGSLGDWHTGSRASLYKDQRSSEQRKHHRKTGPLFLRI